MTTGVPPRRTATVQLCTDECLLVMQLSAMSRMPVALRAAAVTTLHSTCGAAKIPNRLQICLEPS